ncbi:MAG: hypothetical protein HY393_00095 [Candidatus Diapherotrites archaeon]|nr:hypothetical protein [Candidatus Diapherotrites archaeon]
MHALEALLAITFYLLALLLAYQHVSQELQYLDAQSKQFSLHAHALLASDLLIKHAQPNNPLQGSAVYSEEKKRVLENVLEEKKLNEIFLEDQNLQEYFVQRVQWGSFNGTTQLIALEEPSTLCASIQRLVWIKGSVLEKGMVEVRVCTPADFTT